MKLKFSSKHLLALGFILCLFFSLRLFLLDHLPVFVDEAIYVRWSQVMRNEPTLRFLPQSDGKQPLFMWLNISAFKISSDPLIAGRLISVMAGLGSLIGIGVLAFLLSQSLNIGLIAAFIYAITPFTVFFDRMALVDSLLAMFGVWSLILGLLFVKYRRLDLSLLLGFALGGGLLTKSPAIFFYFWQVLLAIFYFRTSKKQFKLETLKLLGGWLIALLISQLLFNILRLGPNFHLINSRNQDYVYTFREILSHPLSPLIGNLKTTFNWLWALLSPVTLILILIGFFKKFKLSLSLLLISFMPLVSQGLIAKVYTSRYILFATLPLLIIASFSLFDLLKSKIRGLIFIFLILLLPLCLSLNYAFRPEKANMPFDMRSGYLEEWTAGTGQKQVADYLINHRVSGRQSIVGTEGYFGTLPDGLQIYTQKYPDILVIGTGLPIKTIPDQLVNALTVPTNDVYLVVNQSRNLMLPESLINLELIAQYPKSIRINGSQEALQFYKLKSL